MAFRTSVLRRFPFDTSIGHVGKLIRGGEETDVIARMRQPASTACGSARPRCATISPAHG